MDERLRYAAPQVRVRPRLVLTRKDDRDRASGRVERGMRPKKPKSPPPNPVTDSKMLREYRPFKNPTIRKVENAFAMNAVQVSAKETADEY